MTTYSYNIRSWITNIKTILDNRTIFNQKLNYERLIIEGNRKRQFGGNVSAVSWKTDNQEDRSYNFEYDDHSRLKNAIYSGLGEIRHILQLRQAWQYAKFESIRENYK